MSRDYQFFSFLKSPLIQGIFIFFLGLINGLSHPSLYPLLCPIAACVGLAPFFLLVGTQQSMRKRFLLGLLFFLAIHGVQMSWLLATKYHGPAIYAGYFILISLIAIQGGILGLYAPLYRTLSGGVFLASLWVILEWLRTFFLSGYTWNPTGLTLSANEASLQLASVGGVFGLSFIAVLTNAFIAFCLTRPNHKAGWILTVLIAITPYVYGQSIINGYDRQEKGSQNVRVALLQTGLKVEQKMFMPPWQKDFIHPVKQWEKIFFLIDKAQNEGPIDLIILPEAAVPYREDETLIWNQDFKFVFKSLFSAHQWNNLGLDDLSDEGKISHRYIADLFSRHFQADIIIGMDSLDPDRFLSYNSAFLFSPTKKGFQKYNKQKLMPIAEYLPFSLLEELARSYGIIHFFTPGGNPTLLKGKFKYAPSVCYDECFPALMRYYLQGDPDFLVNMSNDAWFPGTWLPSTHYHHGKIRSVELGRVLLRSCNHGVTCVVDPLGRLKQTFSSPNQSEEFKQGVLIADVPLSKKTTLYSLWGELPLFAIFFVSAALVISKRNKILVST